MKLLRISSNPGFPYPDLGAGRFQGELSGGCEGVGPETGEDMMTR